MFTVVALVHHSEYFLFGQVPLEAMFAKTHPQFRIPNVVVFEFLRLNGCGDIGRRQY